MAQESEWRGSKIKSSTNQNHNMPRVLDAHLIPANSGDTDIIGIVTWMEIYQYGQRCIIRDVIFQDDNLMSCETYRDDNGTIHAQEKYLPIPWLSNTGRASLHILIDYDQSELDIEADGLLVDHVSFRCDNITIEHDDDYQNDDPEAKEENWLRCPLVANIKNFSIGDKIDVICSSKGRDHDELNVVLHFRRVHLEDE